MTQLLKSEESLSEKVVRGSFWVFSLRATERSLVLIKIIIVTRLLSPNDFGLFGIALLTISILENFSVTGFQAALIQKNEKIINYLDVAWTVSVIRGFVLFLILFVSAPYLSIFFNQSEATSIIQIIGVSIFIRGLTNIGIVYFQKELQIKRLFIYSLSTKIIEFIVTVLAAFLLKNVWALVAGQLIGSVAMLIGSYLIHPYRPKLDLNMEKVKKLFGFGKWVLGLSILTFLVTEGDDAFVGKLLGATMLGFYQMAYRFSNMPATEITHVIFGVMFPAYSKMQEDIPRLREGYLKVLMITAFLSFPIGGLIFFLAPEFVNILLGEKWMPMVPAMRVLVLWGLIRSIGATTGPVFYGLGKPEIATKLQCFQVIVMFILLYPLTIKWGILGTSLAVVLASLASNIIVLFRIVRLIECRTWNFIKLIVCPLISVMIASSFIMILKRNLLSSKGVSGFFLSIILGLFIYLCVSYLLDRFCGYQLKKIFKEILSVLFKTQPGRAGTKKEIDI